MQNIPNNHGFILDTPNPEDWVFGSELTAGGAPLQPDRDWRPFVPKKMEVQNIGYETYACTNFGTDNAFEILVNRMFGIELDLSDRWFAKASGTDPNGGGNSPHKVGEYFRKNGVVDEIDWVFDKTIDTVEKFYAPYPPALDDKAKKLLDEYTFKHEFVPNNAQALYDALQFSPIGFSVEAWNEDEDGYYYKKTGYDNHWVVCVYAEFGKYWLILDTYLDDGVLYKKVRWDALPAMAKRYAITRTDAKAKKNFLDIVRQVYEVLVKHGLLRYFPSFITDFTNKQPIVEKPKEDTKPRPNLIPSFCKAIEIHEGYGLATAVTITQNNNPGALRYSPYQTGMNSGFAVFPNYETGWKGLVHQVTIVHNGTSPAYNEQVKRRHASKQWLDVKDCSDLSLLQFFEIWAPRSDNNDPKRYAEFVAERLGVTIDFKIGDLA